MKLLEHFKELTVHPKNAQELKGLILQLAVQGKLTRKWREENPDVEPASDLLGKIISEKERLIKEKQIKKEKPLPEISENEIPYELPERWVWCRLGNLAQKLGAGSTPSGGKSSYTENGIMFFRSQNIHNYFLKLEQVAYINEETHEKMKGTKVQAKDLLLNITGGSIGRCALVPDVFDTANVSQHVAIIRLVDLGLRMYMHSLIVSNAFQETIMDVQVGVSREGLSMTKLKLFLVPLPPLEEQKAIVEVVNQLFAEVEQLEALTKERIKLKADYVTSALNQLTQAAEQDTASQWAFLQQQFGTFFTEKESIKKLREGILQLAVQGKLTRHWRATVRLSGVEVESAAILLEKIKAEKEQLIREKKIKKEKPLPGISEDEVPNVFPEGWVWCRLQDLEYILGDGIHGTPEYSLNGDYFFINGNNLNDGIIEIKPHTKKVSEKEYLKHNRPLNNRTILVSINGTIGNTAFYNGEKVMLGKSACYFNLFEGIDKEYIRQLIKSEYFRDYAFLSATGTTIKNVSLQTMRSFVVPFPPIEEQKAIVGKVNALMALCDKLEQEIEANQTTQEEWTQSCLREVVKN